MKQERQVTKTCPDCGGGRARYIGFYSRPIFLDCGTCKGTGKVPTDG